MLTSIALLWLLGMALGAAARKLHLPALVGMLLAGILLGPFGADLLSPALLSVSADLRRLALILILLRAGLSLDLGSLRRSGRSAVLLCFLPAACEVLGMVLLAPRLLGVSVLDAAILGAVVGAVSPAVIVPRMLDLMEAGYGTEQGILYRMERFYRRADGTPIPGALVVSYGFSLTTLAGREARAGQVPASVFENWGLPVIQ